MNKFTEEDIKNIIALVQLAPINGGQAHVVGEIIDKLKGLLQSEKGKGAPGAP